MCPTGVIGDQQSGDSDSREDQAEAPKASIGKLRLSYPDAVDGPLLIRSTQSRRGGAQQSKPKDLAKAEVPRVKESALRTCFERHDNWWKGKRAWRNLGRMQSAEKILKLNMEYQRRMERELSGHLIKKVSAPGSAKARGASGVRGVKIDTSVKAQHEAVSKVLVVAKPNRGQRRGMISAKERAYATFSPWAEAGVRLVIKERTALDDLYMSYFQYTEKVLKESPATKTTFLRLFKEHFDDEIRSGMVARRYYTVMKEGVRSCKKNRYHGVALV